MRNSLLFLTILILSLGTLLYGQDTLYTETFANGALQNAWYPEYGGNNMEVEFYPGNPSGDSWVGKLGNDLSGGGVGLSISGNPNFTDFYFEAQVFIPLSEGTYYGIEFRVDSTGNSVGYQFLARPSDGKLRFRRRDGNIPVPVVQEWTGSQIPGGFPTTDGWHKMAVKAMGDQFWFYFDGQELPGCPITDNTFASGWIGVYIWDFMLAPIYIYVDDLFVLNTTVGINDPQKVSTDFQLYQNYPNPFNPTTAISFQLPVRESVKLTIYNSLGQRVRNLASGVFTPGKHQLLWDARDDFGQKVPAGVYYYQLQARDQRFTRKMILLK